MKNYIICTCIALIAFMSSCSKDEEQLPVNNTCETTDMSFSNDILPIFTANCLVCHSASTALGNITLDNYNGVLQTVETNRLIGAINHSAGFSPMPQNAAKLAACQIDKITAWVNQGATNN